MKRLWKNKIVRYGLFLGVSPFVFILLYFTAALIGLYVPTSPNEIEGARSYEIHVAVGQIHTDLILPTKTDVMDWTNLVPISDFSKLSQSPRYIQVGWGDKVFYLEMEDLRDLTFSVAFRATVLPTDSLMHITYYNRVPHNYYKIKTVRITKSQYQKIVDEIRSRFKMKNGSTVLLPNKGYYSNDNFYEAIGRYHMFNTCNLWTNRVLKKAEIKTSIWSPLKYGIAKFIE